MSTSRFEEFKVKDLFYGVSGDTDIKKDMLTDNGEYVITSGLENLGIAGRTCADAKVVGSGAITVDMFGNAFYRGFPFKMVTHARVFALRPKVFDLDEHLGLYFVSALHFLPLVFSYSKMCTFEKLSAYVLSLPIQLDTNNNPVIDSERMYHSKGFVPDWDYMRERIRELEQARIRELVMYLKVTGFDDCVLTDEDQAVLAAWREQTPPHVGVQDE